VRLSTRLLLPLLASVMGIMMLYAAWALRQREDTLAAEAKRETHAYAAALGLALEYAFRDGHLTDVQEIIDRISREPKIYGVLVYGADGRLLSASDPLRGLIRVAPSHLLRAVLDDRGAVTLQRELEGQQVYSVIRPIAGADGATVAAVEVAQPLSFVEAEKARTRQRFVLNTLTLLAVMTALILGLVRRFIARPLRRLLLAVRALGAGELTHRIPEDRRGGELAELAAEFNQMADRLQTARTAREREAEERIALARRLREAEKLAAVGNLAAGLAHEIAAPLNVVTGRAEMMLRRETPPETRERHLRIIMDQIARITAIIRNLLDFARRREPRIQPVELGMVVDGLLDFLEAEFARARVRPHRTGPASAWVHGDPHLLHQVLLNLVINAVQALERSDGERNLTVRIRPATRAEAVGVATTGGGPWTVEVEDDGPGIEAGDLPRIFEAFFTTKGGGGQGTGLGLAVARSIAEEHGGHLTGGNREGRTGAVFRLTVPAAPVPEPVHA
jgi:two-component system, NtrC family, sensor kinase